MSWQSVKDFISSVWLCCKKHWQLLAGFFGAVTLFIFFRKRKPDPDIVDNLITSHNSETNIIDNSHKIESELVENARARHDSAVGQIIDDSNRQTAALEEKRDDLVHEIINNHGDNPEEITRRLGAATGIRVTGDRR